MTGAAVAGIGWVTAAGAGEGRQHTVFSMTDGALPAQLYESARPGRSSRRGRQPEYARVGMTAVAYALRDAGLAEWTAKRPIGLSASTTLGCLSTDVEYHRTLLPEGGGMASPYLFAYTLPNCFAGEAAIEFGLTGPTFVAEDGRGESLLGWRLGLESLASGECPAIVAGHLDYPVGAALPGIEAVVPGAVFMVLDAGGTAPVSGYGTIEWAGGGLRHNGAAVTNIVALVQACLRARAVQGTERGA